MLLVDRPPCPQPSRCTQLDAASNRPFSCQQSVCLVCKRKILGDGTVSANEGSSGLARYPSGRSGSSDTARSKHAVAVAPPAGERAAAASRASKSSSSPRPHPAETPPPTPPELRFAPRLLLAALTGDGAFCTARRRKAARRRHKEMFRMLKCCLRGEGNAAVSPPLPVPPSQRKLQGHWELRSLQQVLGLTFLLLLLKIPLMLTHMFSPCARGEDYSRRFEIHHVTGIRIICVTLPG